MTKKTKTLNIIEYSKKKSNQITTIRINLLNYFTDTPNCFCSSMLCPMPLLDRAYTTHCNCLTCLQSCMLLLIQDISIFIATHLYIHNSRMIFFAYLCLASLSAVQHYPGKLGYLKLKVKFHLWETCLGSKNKIQILIWIYTRDFFFFFFCKQQIVHSNKSLKTDC